MSILHDFEYYNPRNIEEVLQLRAEYRDKTRILAGGTDLVVQMKDNIIAPDVVIDIKGIEAFHEITFDENILFIGACITFSELIESEIIQRYFPLIKEMSLTVASMGIRNRATMIGNICSAVPSADSAPILLVYDADVIVRSASKDRIVPITEWFAGPKKTTLKSDEIVTGIALHFPERKHAGCYERLGRYSGEDLAQAGICILAFDDDQYHVACCAVGPIPKRLYHIEEFLNGKVIDQNVIQEAKQIMLNNIFPISDVRASKEYREHMMGIMLERGLMKAVSRLHGGENA
ncbi:MAG: xanthine dehydrogenase family protein subunit M [Candidatus Cloacimonetes bacterium]|nr:xanthine dehydrogenase family protein subunit M [Candidatus Cloacimonadota bacterium]